MFYFVSLHAYQLCVKPCFSAAAPGRTEIPVLDSPKISGTFSKERTNAKRQPCGSAVMHFLNSACCYWVFFYFFVRKGCIYSSGLLFIRHFVLFQTFNLPEFERLFPHFDSNLNVQMSLFL